MTAVLKISDDTAVGTINLLALPGFQLESWRPQVAFYKGDGSFQSSPLAPGRQLVNKQFDNITESFSFKAQAVDQNALIRDIQDLVRLLEKATSYWTTDFQDTPVYIEAKATDETNTRYGHIMTYRIPELENPYDQPFLQPECESVMDALTLIIEHTPWTENKPDTGTATPNSAVETFESRPLGNVDSTGTRVPTTANEVYIGNKQNKANLTHIFIDDGGVFSANLMDAALPFAFLPAAPAVGDAVYFGIDKGVADEGAFSSLVFDISIAGAGYTGIWEYSNGGWTALTVQDNTNADGAMTGVAFDTTGVNSVHWEMPSNFAFPAINGVVAYWVRYRITGIPGALTAPTQQNRDIYSIVWGYTEIQSEAILGDIPSLLTIKLYDQGDKDGSGGSAPDLFNDRVLLGLRSLSRGSLFSAYLNCTNVGLNGQNPTGVTVSAGANTVFGPRSVATLDAAVYTPVGVEALADRVIFTLDSSLMQEYYGRYHVFLRGQKSNVNDYTLRLRVTVGSGGIDSFSETITFSDAPVSGTPNSVVYDMGIVDIPSGKLKNDETGDQTEMAIQVGAESALGSFWMVDLFLLPIDEWAGDFGYPSDDSDAELKRQRYLLIDSIQSRKNGLRSVVFNSTNDRAVAFYLTVSNGDAILQANEDQKLWLFAMKAIYDGGVFDQYESIQDSAFTIQLERNQQYITMRGDR